MKTPRRICLEPFLCVILLSSQIFAQNDLPGEDYIDDCGGCLNDGMCVDMEPPPFPDMDNMQGLTFGPQCECAGTGFVGELCEIPCDVNCMNDGTCVPAEDDSGVATCECTSTWTGPTCKIFREECADGHECLNGAMCIPDGNGNGYTCDCSSIDGENVYAGAKCEYGATKFCKYGSTFNMDSFCVNGGDCIETVAPDEEHMGCHCLEGFEGEHCQYILGQAPKMSAPEDDQAAGSESNDGSSNSGKAIAFVGIMIGTLIGVAFLVRRSMKKRAARRDNAIMMNVTAAGFSMGEKSPVAEDAEII